MKKEQKAFVIKTLCLFMVCVITGMFVDSLASVFNIVGAISANSIVFIFPCLFYFRLIEMKGKDKKVKYYLAKVMFIFFILFAILSVASSYITLNWWLIIHYILIKYMI